MCIHIYIYIYICGNSTGLNDPTLPKLPPDLSPFQKQSPNRRLRRYRNCAASLMKPRIAETGEKKHNTSYIEQCAANEQAHK